MTCIVGIRHEGKVWVGGDSAGTTRAGSQRMRADRKVFAKDAMAFGFCGSFRLGQLIRYKLQAPVIRENMDPHEYLATEFVDAVRTTLKRGGNAHVENGVEQIEGSFIVGWRGELYHVEADLQVAVCAEPYVAAGSGFELALGSLHTTAEDGHKPKDRATWALEAAAAFDAFVAPPFEVVSV